MAEKEERILIKKEINYHPPYGGWCGDGKEIVLTRQEAINRMAKAIEYNLNGSSFNSLAEDVLNALLEDEYGRTSKIYRKES